MITPSEEVIASLNLRIYDLCQTIQHLSQEVEQLKKQLEGAIVPKFKIGQEVWLRYGDGHSGRCVVKYLHEIKDREYTICYTKKTWANGDIESRVIESTLFATQAEAEQSLKGGE